jgi:hypothetical protein
MHGSASDLFTFGGLGRVLMSSRRPWTEQELQLLKELVGRNLSLPVMALKLGRSVAAIESKAAQQHIALTRVKRSYHHRATAQPADVLVGRAR